MSFRLDDYDYQLPEHCIAHTPANPRDASRLLHLSNTLEHKQFRDLPDLLNSGDLLVINRTRVFPARLKVRRASGGKVELLLFAPLDGDVYQACEWQALGKPSKTLRPGMSLLGDGFELEVVERRDETVRIRGREPLWPTLQRLGEIPLPPYIERPKGPNTQDTRDYQSMFAETAGAVAAPTASLHFTHDVVDTLKAKGVQFADVILHVGPGTFLPIRAEEDFREHVMHSEFYAIPNETLATIAATKAHGNRVIAVGTTVTRALETYAQTQAAIGASKLFIYPGFKFKTVDALLTNFHLPRSSLLLLVCAFAGKDRMLNAYQQAVQEGYRFFSYGDAMLVQP
jgi:S-adenosylmethionine:tRNA ribosyltransferase-isomerase